MRSLVLALSLFVGVLAPSSSAAQAAFDGPSVLVREVDGQEWWSVQAQNVSLERVLVRIAERASLTLEGLEAARRAGLVTIELTNRPFEQVLEYLLGSAGLRHTLRRGTLTVFRDQPESESLEERLNLATAAWIRATTRFPDHDSAPAGRLAQGELAEIQGYVAAARAQYLSLIEDYPSSPQVAEAYMRAGRLATRAGLWAEASEHFRTLANIDAPEYRAPARLGLARATIELGDPQTALHILSALESEDPAEDISEHTARDLVRAQAQNAKGHYMEALRTLDARAQNLDPLGAWEALRIRATALEGIGLPGEAARAWLVYAEDANLEERDQALQHAARLSLEADDELGTLFICRRARTLGIEQGFHRFEREARERLGFPVAGDARGVDLRERIMLGEELIDDNDLAKATPIFENLFLGRQALDSDDTARVTVGWAHCVSERQGVEAAIAILRTERETFESLEARRRLDLGAARIFERNELFERAVDAYQGSY